MDRRVYYQLYNFFKVLYHNFRHKMNVASYNICTCNLYTVTRYYNFDHLFVNKLGLLIKQFTVLFFFKERQRPLV